jgi:hypothetical protein
MSGDRLYAAKPRYHRLNEAYRDLNQGADGAQYFVQPERVCGFRVGRGAQLLAVDLDGPAGDRRSIH